ncbi:MAG: hypothetical protein M5U19_18580 [Microthrixaceae bacterium]|nr:hypothetical protein [Microthrixaceae bacterium]
MFDFHGLMEGADVHSKMTGYSDLAQQEGFVVVFPEGTGQPLEGHQWGSGRQRRPPLLRRPPSPRSATRRASTRRALRNGAVQRRHVHLVRGM